LAVLATPQDWLSASVVRLGGRDNPAVISLQAGFTGGTFFVIAPQPHRAPAKTWSIQALAQTNFLARNDLGRWAYHLPGYHDGPLQGEVMKLDPTAAGRPRFLIHAMAMSSMGSDVPAQVSVWEWTGSEAQVEFIQGYRTTDESHHLERKGNLLRITTREESELIYGCGSCDEPRGTWTLRVTPTSIIDLGHVYDEPLLQLVDRLLTRIALGEDASALAAPQVIDGLKDFYSRAAEDNEASAAASADPEEGADPLRPFRGMLDAHHVSGPPGRRQLDLATDAFHFVFTVVKRGGADYVSEINEVELAADEP
jgi:hypothetical protein